MERKRLYLPIETKNREFDAKLLLSCFAAERGYEVFLGNQKVLLRSFDTLPRGIIIDKRGAYDKIPRYWHYKSLGFLMTAHDEEGFVTWNWDEYQRSRKFSDELFVPLECFFAWGPQQASFIQEKTVHYKEKVVPVGHPRLDMTRREFRNFYAIDAQKLKERYGRFILINTNFALWNHYYGEHGLIKAKKAHDEKLKEFYIKIGEHQQQLFDHFAELIKTLRQSFPDISVVLRPHPSENQENWKRVLPDDEKITVVHEGNVLPWLIASEVVIHNSCTTGVEAFLLGEPVISYRPVADRSLENELPNIVSEQEFELDGIVSRVEQYLKFENTEIRSERYQAVSRYITGLDGASASERIVDALDRIPLPALTLDVRFRRMYMHAKHFARTLLKRHKPEAVIDNDDDKGTRYRNQKFPGLSLSEVTEALGRFQQVTGRFSDIQVSQEKESLFRLIQH